MSPGRLENIISGLKTRRDLSLLLCRSLARNRTSVHICIYYLSCEFILNSLLYRQVKIINPQSVMYLTSILKCNNAPRMEMKAIENLILLARDTYWVENWLFTNHWKLQKSAIWSYWLYSITKSCKSYIMIIVIWDLWKSRWCLASRTQWDWNIIIFQLDNCYKEFLVDWCGRRVRTSLDSLENFHETIAGLICDLSGFSCSCRINLAFRFVGLHWWSSWRNLLFVVNECQLRKVGEIKWNILLGNSYKISFRLLDTYSSLYFVIASKCSK